MVNGVDAGATWVSCALWRENEVVTFFGKNEKNVKCKKSERRRKNFDTSI